MPSNEAIIAAAGGRKTTRIVQHALDSPSERVALVTFTQNNTEELSRRIYEQNTCIPSHIEVRTWLSFLLREMARPYQNYLYPKRIDGICWIDGRSDRYANKTDVARFYFGNGSLIYSDKISQFICECDKASKGAIIRRLEQRFDRLYIDEIQDMWGYDIDLIERILRSNVKLMLVGDHRQATFRTNNAARNRGSCGTHIIDTFKQWEKLKLCGLSYEVETYRCNQAIADLADAFFPKEPRTISRNLEVTGHDGVFSIPSKMVHDYIGRFRPQILRLDKRTLCDGYDAKNFGESKGLTFDRVLIFPHGKGKDWLSTGDFKHAVGSASKLYVGATRARYSVAFVFDGVVRVSGVNRYQ